MRRFTQIFLILSILLLFIPIQSTEAVTAATPACPPEGCTVYIPTVQKWVKRLKIGMVTDVSGINDKSFNQSAWKGVQYAEARLGAYGAYLVSQSSSDYARNIHSFINLGYDLIITVGWNMGDATKSAAQTHPTQKFSIVDHAYTPILPNVVSQMFASEQAAFLCGYLAAGMTQTGKVATFGGMNIYTVTQFMNGYFQGVAYYNLENATSVQVLGWDPVTKSGEFTDDFNNLAAGYAMAQKLMNQGADIVFPVAGGTGLGAAQAVQEETDAWVIGVDSDWTETAPEYSDVLLTSAMKVSWATTYEIINQVYQSSFSGGNVFGNLANQGVGLGKIASSVPQALITKIEIVREKIISGDIIVTP